MSFHRDVLQADNHGPYRYVFANATDRNNGTGYTAAELTEGVTQRKWAYQIDTQESFVILTDTPTWTIVGSAFAHMIASHTDTSATGSQLDALVSALNTALHYHDADRARANHTGTQPSSTISDADTANGVPLLDGSGFIKTSQLPKKMMEFEGNWNASTNTPTLANTDIDLKGTTYKVNVAGSVDFGAGLITFKVGDWVYNDGTIWSLQDGVESTLIFGSEFQEAKTALDVVSTNSASDLDLVPSNILSFSTGAIPAGKYKIAVSFEWSLNDEKNGFLARIQVDNTDIGRHWNMTPKKKWQITDQKFYVGEGWKNLDLASGTYTIDFDYGAEVGKTAYIRNVIMEFWRIS